MEVIFWLSGLSLSLVFSTHPGLTLRHGRQSGDTLCPLSSLLSLQSTNTLQLHLTSLPASLTVFLFNICREREREREAYSVVAPASVELYWVVGVYWADSHSQQHELSPDIQSGFVSSLCCPPPPPPPPSPGQLANITNCNLRPSHWVSVLVLLKVLQHKKTEKSLHISVPAFLAPKCVWSVEVWAHTIFNLNYFEKWS